MQCEVHENTKPLSLVDGGFFIYVLDLLEGVKI